MGSIPTLNMCDLRYSGQSVYRQSRITDNNADTVIGFIKNTLLAAGWTITGNIPPKAYWITSLSSFPTQSSGTLVPFPYPSGAIAATFVVSGVTKTLYFFDPTKYSPTTPPANVYLVTVASTQSQTAQNYAAAVGAATGTSSSYVFDGLGNVIIIASDASLVTLSDGTAISGSGFGTGAVWGYHGAFPYGNTHFLNGGSELQSQSANGKTQYKVQLLRGGPIPHVIANVVGVQDFSGGAYEHWVSAVSPGDGQSGGQTEAECVVVRFIDKYGGYITYEIAPGWYVGGATAPRTNMVKMVANPYQFFYWSDGFVLGQYTSCMAHLFACAPYTDNPAINYCVVVASGWEFDTSQYPSPPYYFVKFQGDSIRSTASWPLTYAVAINGAFKSMPPGGPIWYGDFYRAAGLIGLSLGAPFPAYSMNGALIASTPYLLAPAGDPAITAKDAVIVGSVWDAAYLANKFGNSSSSLNDANLPDSSYERASSFMGRNWMMVETAVQGAASYHPCQSLWMTYDS